MDNSIVNPTRPGGRPTGRNRAIKVAEKRALRQLSFRTPGRIPFAEIADDPLYQRIAAATCPADLKAELDSFGLDNPARVAALGSPYALEDHLVSRCADGEVEARSTQTVFAGARQEAIRSYRLLRHALALKDPMNLGLRHTRTRLASSAEQALLDAGGPAYAQPSSLQSNQSLAAYLRYLYRIAIGLDRGIGLIPPETGPMRLAVRRPDLAGLVLSETHLKQEIPTIDLVNEVLEAGLGDIDLRSAYHPIALPFDESAATARAALSVLGGMTLDRVAAETATAGFPLHEDFRASQDLAGLLGLVGTLDASSGDGSELALLIEDATGPIERYVSTLPELYGVTDNVKAATVDHLRATLDLDFNSLVQLLGLYAVRQESGQAVSQRDFATAFLDNNKPFEIVSVDSEAVSSTKVVYTGGAVLTASELRSLNYLARLHHGTGLAFHHLNTLLTVPGAAAAVEVGTAESTLADERLATRRVTLAGLRVLAGYLRYRDAFGLEPQAYAALFGELSPYWRADVVVPSDTPATAGLEQTEISFLRMRFGDDAPRLHRLINDATTSIDDPDLSAIVRRGLGLSTVELEALVGALNESFQLTTGLDSRGLGALYRLTTLFRLLGWPVLTGLALIARAADESSADNRLWADLVARNDSAETTERLCDTLDRIVELGRWMTDAELSPDALLAILMPTTPETVRASDADRTWFSDLASAIANSLMSAERFRAFETWESEDAEPIEVTGDAWHAQLRQAGLYRTSGVFPVGIDGDAIEQVCRDALVMNFKVDLGIDNNLEQLQRLIAQLEQALDTQAQTLERQVASLSTALSAAVAGAFCLWAQSHPLDTLDVLLGGPDDTDALVRLFELKRHASVLDALGLSDIEVLMLGTQPAWLGPASASENTNTALPRVIDLEQLYNLQRFTTLQVGAASDAAWFGYLSLANDGRPDANASTAEIDAWRGMTIEAMAVLIGSPVADARAYVDALYGASAVPSDTREIDTVARHARLAEDLHVSAAELLALKAVSTADTRSDLTAAAAAALAGLARFDAGRQVPAFRHALAEVKRDALVAAYLQTRIAGNAELQNRVRDREALYSYLLLDVNVTSAVPTSRIVEAVSSLQLYINRALNGLEPEVRYVNRAALAAQWQLDRQYRPWEANQKLLLYPQNYIEPELRQLSSPEFDALLAAVSGNDINEDAVDAAVNAYMAGLAGVCDLSLCSLFVERVADGNAPANASYHFVARAQWERGRFFYRKLDADFATIAALADPTQYLKALDWSYWQEVVVPNTYELFSDVTVCFFLNRYYFFWLEIEEQKTQSSEGDSGYWSIHPRYMRCDSNALTGPMHTPSLFVEGSLASSSGHLTLAEAFRWSADKPILNGTYHPLAATNAFSFGEAPVSTGTDDELLNAIVVTFGIGLPTADGKLHRTALQMRLTEAWSDALYFVNDDIDTSFEEAAPRDYRCVHPRLPSEDSSVAESNTITGTANLSELFKTYGSDMTTQPFPGAFVENRHHSATVATATFQASSVGSPNLGSVSVECDLGARRYDIRLVPHDNIDPDGQWEFIGDFSSSELSIKLKLTYQVDGQSPLSYQSEYVSRDLPKYRVYPTDLSWREPHNIELVTEPKETLETVVALPDEWTLSAGETATLRVEAVLTREFVNVQLRGVTSGRSSTVLFGTSAPVSPVDRLTVGSFVLRPADGKLATGWSLAGAHGSRNFVHIMADAQSPIDETFLLSNSSAALAALAQSTPRPGGSAGLFALDNQVGSEELGRFVEDFATTLATIYPDDSTVLVDDRKPSSSFHFDAAYGIYGWETFFHIPSAIAASYANSGRYDDALAWLEKIFDPSLDQPWRVLPLIDAGAPENGPSFDTGEVIVDPDRIAADYPFYYQQAAIRYYLETLLAAGDNAYRGLTQETLQQAKATYVAAKRLFADSLSDTLTVLSDRPWVDPTLGDAAADSFEGFLPPYNDELHALYGTIESRLANLRQWRDIEGEPLNIPLLAAPIDPRVLQKSAKAALSLRTADVAEADDRNPVFDFPTVLRSAKGYVENLKTTSARLEAAITHFDDATMGVVELRIGRDSARRAAAMQALVIDAAQKEVDVAEANLVGASNALAHHVGTVLVNYGGLAAVAAFRSVVVLTQLTGRTILAKALTLAGTIKAVIPRVFGFSNGGQQPEQADVVQLIGSIDDKLTRIIKEEKFDTAQQRTLTALELTADTVALSTAVASATLERDQARATLTAELQSKTDLDIEIREAEEIIRTSNNGFTGTAFYGWLADDLKLLFADEWAATQDFCRLLATLYDEETGEEGLGASFLRTTNLGGDYERFNAPHRLALDLERMETAYLRSVLDLQSQTATLNFALSELPALGGERSALESLVEHGETWFELSAELFEAFYPGQYDRRIQSVRVCFPGLLKAGLSPHARLTQIANTRFATRERDPKRGGRVRKNRHALQSVVLGSADVDTAAFESPEGLLKRFQNTGVESRWHLALPAALELKRCGNSRGNGHGSGRGNGRSRAWREQASRHVDALTPHLDEVEFSVAFSGRW